MNVENENSEKLFIPPVEFSDEEKVIWKEIHEAIKSVGYKMRYGDRLVMHEYVKLRIMRDTAMKAWNDKPERYVKIVTGIEKDMKTPKITIKENENYTVMMDCNKVIARILDELKLTPKARAKY